MNMTTRYSLEVREHFPANTSPVGAASCRDTVIDTEPIATGSRSYADARDARLRSDSDRIFLRSRMLAGVTSTSSSSAI